MDAIKDLLAKKVIFHCERRGGDGKKDLEVVHSTASSLPRDRMPQWVTPSLQTVYGCWNGLKLFQPAPDVDEGFRLFAVDEVTDELEELRETFDENLDAYQEESEFQDLEAWLNGLIPIAEIMCSGDKFALDTYHKKDNGECPILFLDHEAYYGGCCDPESMDVVAENAVSLIENVLNDPLGYVASHWIGGDIDDQWYPESMTMV